MANIIGHHHVEKSIQNKLQQGRGDRMLPQSNVLAAASYVRHIFESKKFTYSILGGFQMFCLGNGREVSDLHFTYEDKDFNRIRKKIESDRRLRSPEGMNPLTPSKILVQTGPSFQDVGCSSPATVEVYLLPSGSYGTPPSGTLKDNVVLLSNNSGGILRTFKGLNMLYLVKSLIELCKLRTLSWNPCADVLFLCQRYGGQVQSARTQLDQKATYHNFLSTPFVASLPFNEQRRCYQILSGQAPPPPPPAVTPINLPLPQNGQSRSQSAYGPPNSLPNSNHSSSTPKTHYMNNFENLQQMQKEKPSIRHTINMGLPSRSPPNFSTSPEFTAPPADSRTRYRPISAYNAKRISSGPQLRIDTSAGPFGGSYTHRKVSAPLQNIVAPPPPPQQPVTNTQPSVPFSPLPATLSIQNRRSLTRSDAKRPGARTSYVPNQTLACKPMIESHNPPHQHQTAVFEMSATPTQYKHISAHIETQYEYQKEEQRRLQVVGPNGLYQPSSPPPTLPLPPPPPPPAVPTRVSSTVTEPQQPIYELDSMPAEITTDNDIIASLSADIESAMFPYTNTSNPLTTSTGAAPPPEKTRTNTVLPTSLVAGHGDKHAQRPYTPPSEKGYEQDRAEPSQQPNDDELDFSHTYDIEKIGLASPPLTPAPLAVYKAYRSQQPLSLPAQARSRSASRSPPVYDATEQHQQQRSSENINDRKVDYPNVLRVGKGSVEAILDSSILAMEYQAELPDFDHGYAEH